MTTSAVQTTDPSPAPRAQREIALVDLLDRLLGTGVVLAGDITISLAGVDLVLIKLRALIMSVRDEAQARELTSEPEVGAARADRNGRSTLCAAPAGGERGSGRA